MAKRKLVPYEAVNFTCHNGQTIVPGDLVAAATSSRSGANLRMGRYLGVRNRTKYGQKKQHVVMEYPTSRSIFVHNETGKEYDFFKEYTENPYKTLDWTTSTPQQRAENNRLSESWKESRRMNYSFKTFKYIRVTQLQRNKISPLVGFTMEDTNA